MTFDREYENRYNFVFNFIDEPVLSGNPAGEIAGETSC
jgi:hypothetical protein